MKYALVDTSAIVALLDRSEKHHNKCVSAIENLDATLLTCEAVITESCYLLKSIPGAAEAVLANVGQGILQIPFRLSERIATVSNLMKKYAKLPMDLADACLVDMATELQTENILTLDSDFEIYRWGKNKPFQNLL